jgi:hypothetical protein
MKNVIFCFFIVEYSIILTFRVKSVHKLSIGLSSGEFSDHSDTIIFPEAKVKTKLHYTEEVIWDYDRVGTMVRELLITFQEQMNKHSDGSL